MIAKCRYKNEYQFVTSINELNKIKKRMRKSIDQVTIADKITEIEESINNTIQLISKCNSIAYGKYCEDLENANG